MIRPPPSSALFPYTTLFRSYVVLSVSFQMRLASLSAPIRYAELARTLDVPLESRVEASEVRSEEHTSELQSRGHLVCRLLLEKKKKKTMIIEQLTTISTETR